VQKEGGTAWEIKDLFLLSYINKNNWQARVQSLLLTMLKLSDNKHRQPTPDNQEPTITTDSDSDTH
jgi:hypothetical protein